MKPLLSEHRRHLRMSLKAIKHEIKLRTLEKFKIDKKAAQQSKYIIDKKEDDDDIHITKPLLKIENRMIPNTPENLLLCQCAKNNNSRLMDLRGASFRRFFSPTIQNP